MKWILYCTTCTENGKIYIGVHKTETPEQFDGYYGCGIYKGVVLKNPKTAFQKALKKYGYSKFKRCTLAVYDTEEEAYNMEALLVTKDFIKRRDNYNSREGGIYSNAGYKWIYRYHLDGTFWEEYYGVHELAEKMGLQKDTLSNCVKAKRSFKNSYWSFEKAEKLDLSDYRLNIRSTIYQYTLDGELVKEWESVNDIMDALDVERKTVQQAYEWGKVMKKHLWTKDPDKIMELVKLHKEAKSGPGKKTKIEQYDLDGNLVKVWDSISSCAKEYSKAGEVAKGLRKQTKGFVFKYSNC